jgi:hypothetical protein
MKLVVISSSPLVEKDGAYSAYSPYIKEMEIWARHSDKIAFFSPIWKSDNGLLISKVNFPVTQLFVAKEFNIKSFSEIISQFLSLVCIDDVGRSHSLAVPRQYRAYGLHRAAILSLETQDSKICWKLGSECHPALGVQITALDSK